MGKGRDRILLMQRTRASLEQSGFAAKDLPRVFSLFDTDGNGQLDMGEFRWMLQGMKLGLKKERMVELYSAFDDDHSGGIDDKEFVKALFPERYHEIFGPQEKRSLGSSTLPPQHSFPLTHEHREPQLTNGRDAADLARLASILGKSGDSLSDRQDAITTGNEGYVL